MSDDSGLLERRRACWATGEEAAREAFGWIVEDTLPSAIPTDGPGIEQLTQDLTPKAMERVAAAFAETRKGHEAVAVPEDCEGLIEGAFQMEMTKLLVRRAFGL